LHVLPPDGDVGCAYYKQHEVNGQQKFPFEVHQLVYARTDECPADHHVAPDHEVDLREEPHDSRHHVQHVVDGGNADAGRQEAAEEAYDALKIELDVFGAPYDGTIIAEVEFPSEAAAAAYKPADWFDQDVTGDKRYSNAQMSLRQ
jgi:hypothetical protein